MRATAMNMVRSCSAVFWLIASVVLMSSDVFGSFQNPKLMRSEQFDRFVRRAVCNLHPANRTTSSPTLHWQIVCARSGIMDIAQKRSFVSRVFSMLLPRTSYEVIQQLLRDILIICPVIIT